MLQDRPAQMCTPYLGSPAARSATDTDRKEASRPARLVFKVEFRMRPNRATHKLN